MFQFDDCRLLWCWVHGVCLFLFVLGLFGKQKQQKMVDEDKFTFFITGSCLSCFLSFSFLSSFSFSYSCFFFFFHFSFSLIQLLFSHSSFFSFFLPGGSGFVGRHLIRYLVANNHNVRALVRSEKSAEVVKKEVYFLLFSCFSFFLLPHSPIL